MSRYSEEKIFSGESVELDFFMAGLRVGREVFSLFLSFLLLGELLSESKLLKYSRRSFVKLLGSSRFFVFLRIFDLKSSAFLISFSDLSSKIEKFP